MEWVLAAWRKRRRHEMISLTKGDVRRLKNLLGGLGVGPHAALRMIKPRIQNLRPSTVQLWLSGRETLVRHDQYDQLVAAFQNRLDTGRNRIKLTPDHLAALEAEKARTGVEVLALARDLAHLPDAPLPGMIFSWMSGTIGSARKSDYDLVLESWRALPDVGSPELGLGDYSLRQGRIVLEPRILVQLESLKMQTGMSGTALIKRAREQGKTIPAGFTHSMVISWLTRNARTAKPEHLEFAVEMWRSLPEKEEHPTIRLDDDRMKRLKGFRTAGFIPTRAFDGAPDIPNGLSAATVSRWLGGHADNVREDHWKWVVARCASLDASGLRRIPITKEMREALIAERERTGVNQAALLRNANEVPDGLSNTMISAWINGGAATAREDLYNWVQARWDEL